MSATKQDGIIEQIWKEIRKREFRNEIFDSLEKVIERLQDTIAGLEESIIQKASPAGNGY
jgi:predicted nucleic acid-binding protein